MTISLASLRTSSSLREPWNQPPPGHTRNADAAVTRQPALLGWDRSGGQHERKRLLRQLRTRTCRAKRTPLL